LGSLLKKYIFALFLLLLTLNLSATGYPARGLSAVPLSLYPTVTGSGVRDCFINQASLAFASQYSIGLTYYSRFWVKELAVKSISAVIPIRNGAFGINYSNTGFSELMYHSFSGSAGMRLSDVFSFGVEAGIEATGSTEAYARDIIATCETGAIFSVTDNLRVGLHVVNPVPNSLRSYPMSSSISAGVENVVSNRVSVSLLIEKTTMLPLSVSTGFSYQPVPSVVVRAGYSTATSAFGFTFGYRFGRYDSELSFLSHSRLGLSSVASIFGGFGK